MDTPDQPAPNPVPPKSQTPVSLPSAEITAPPEAAALPTLTEQNPSLPDPSIEVAPVMSPETPPPTAPQTPHTSPAHLWVTYLLAAVMLLLGGALGYLISSNTNTSTKLSSIPKVAAPAGQEVKLPSDATLIQSCSDHKGALYAKPADIPQGPVYMVNNGAVIGIEFMLDAQKFVSNQSFKDLPGVSIKVDHANIGLISQGHEGFPAPHYHVDLYRVPFATEQAITCKKA